MEAILHIGEKMITLTFYRNKKEVGFAYFYKNDNDDLICNCYEYFDSNTDFFFKAIKKAFFGHKIIIKNNFCLGTDIFNGKEYIEV